MKARLLEALLIMLVAAGATTLWLRPTETPVPPAASAPAAPAAPAAGVPGWPELNRAMPAGAQPPRPIPWREVEVDLSEADRAAALAALRTRVPASEVPDEDVRVVFWDDCKFPKGDYRMGGFWVGEDRSVILLWDLGRGGFADIGFDASGKAPSYQEFRAESPDLSEAALRVREEFRYNGRAVVPLGPSRDPAPPTELQSVPGFMEIQFADGWELECSHWSVGDIFVAPGRPPVLSGHIL